jgi:hypothetical protein
MYISRGHTHYKKEEEKKGYSFHEIKFSKRHTNKQNKVLTGEISPVFPVLTVRAVGHKLLSELTAKELTGSQTLAEQKTQALK